MIQISNKQFPENLFKEILLASKAKSDCVRRIGFNYYSGQLWKEVEKVILSLGLSTDHFDPSFYRRERRGLTINLSKEELEKLVSQKLTLKQLATAFNCSQSNIKYWIKKFNLKLFRGARGKLPKDFNMERLCQFCGKTDPNKFYGNKTTVCAICHNKYNLKKGQEKKKFARDHLGGKCIHCGFDKYPVSLDIHHLLPEHKDPMFKSMRGWSIDRIVKELEHCVLLCRNCHAALHNGDIELK